MRANYMRRCATCRFGQKWRLQACLSRRKSKRAMRVKSHDMYGYIGWRALSIREGNTYAQAAFMRWAADAARTEVSDACVLCTSRAVTP